MDNEWEKKKWDQAWEDSSEPGGVRDEEMADFGEPKKNKLGGEGCKSPKNSKKRKMESDQGDIWGEEVGPESQAKLEFLGSGVSKPKKNWTQQRLVTLSGTEWFIHQLIKEVSGNSVEIGEDIVLAKNMPEWNKVCEDEELLNWKALQECDEKDKLASKKREKTTKYKNKNKNLSIPCMVKNEDKKKRGKGKVRVAPGQKTLDGFGFKSVKVEKKQLESGEIDEYPNTYKIEELEIQMEYYLMKFEQNIQDVVTAEGGDETNGLLEQTKEEEKTLS